MRQSIKEKMWVSGWMLGKYDQLQNLPESSAEAKEWWKGFTMGTVEACLYERLGERLDLLLADFPMTYRLVKSVIVKSHVVEF